MKMPFDTKSIVCFRVRREYNKFQYNIMKLDKRDIINQCNKIHFYGCVKEFFQFNDTISEDVFSFLVQKRNVIHAMWELYLKHEKFGCSTWDGLSF